MGYFEDYQNFFGYQNLNLIFEWFYYLMNFLLFTNFNFNFYYFVNYCYYFNLIRFINYFIIIKQNFSYDFYYYFMD